MPDTSASKSHDEALGALDESRAAAERSIQELAKRAERAIQEGIESLRLHSRDYVDTASDRLDEAQRYVVDKVHEKPVSSTLAALGIGVLVGMLIAGGRRH
jgi:ElaB/YqjD/DUF883 family membrane-anchored ribosome-binding protein